ncbi:acyl-homoserine-lactone synthase [Roseibium sp.]|uniref:acyl-homoserine-lactone synthase n=1 Tax=Roseibium sp. TaxID=1936156 RepID=UPI003A9712F5
MTIHEHGDLFVKYLRSRHETFIQRRQWQLPEVEGMEFDQYDTPLCRWVIVHEFGEIFAGLRLIPTTARCGLYSYMIRDTQLGLIDSIPRDLLFIEAPVREDIWEATRMFISHKVPAERRQRIQTILMQHAALTASHLGAARIIGIVPAVFPRWLKRIGMTAFPVGPLMTIDGDRVQSAIMNVVDM